MRERIPLGERRGDIFLLGFFALNLFFITYMVDIEQILIADPSSFEYPAWPPRWTVDLVHWWGRNFDPLLLARPPFWRATIWIDVLFFGPFYAVALYAYAFGREWIRVPSVAYASVMLTNVTVILFEELLGVFATDSPVVVVFANAWWLLVPIYILVRMVPTAHPFTRAAHSSPESEPSLG